MDTEGERQSQVVKYLQYALFDEDFGCAPRDRAFVDAYIANGGNAADAARVAQPELKKGSARVVGSRQAKRLEADKPGEERPQDDEIRRYYRWKQAHLVMRSRLTEDEVVANARRVYLHGVGEMPMRKTVMPKVLDEEGDEQTGTAFVTLVHEPNLGAANAANELLRKIGGFGKDDPAETPVSVTLTLNLDGKPRTPAHG